MSPSDLDFSACRARVLIVEPSSVFREMQSLLLQSAGYSASNCDDVDAALQGLRAAAHDVVVLNANAGDVENAQFVATLRRDFPSVSVVYVAAALTVEITRDLSRLGVAVVLQRPLTPELLITKLDEVSRTSVRPACRHPVAVPALPLNGAAIPRDAAAAPPVARPVDGGPSRFSPSAFFASASPVRMDSVPPFRTAPSAGVTLQSAHPFSR